MQNHYCSNFVTKVQFYHGSYITFLLIYLTSHHFYCLHLETLWEYLTLPIHLLKRKV